MVQATFRTQLDWLRQKATSANQATTVQSDLQLQLSVLQALTNQEKDLLNVKCVLQDFTAN